MSGTILIIDDEAPIRRAVKHALESSGSRVIEAASVRDAIDETAAQRPDLIILDLGLPDGDGRDVLREIRSWSATPVLVLSARESDAEKVALLDAGADDYLVKPFSSAELQARVRALLRRANATPISAGSGPITIDSLAIDLAKPSIARDGAPLHLTRTEWELLRTLLRHAGRTLTHRQIFLAVWGDVSGDAQQYLRVHIRSLRQKLEADPVRPKLIVTEPGVGYRFDPVP